MNARKAGTWALPAALTLIAVIWAVAAIGDTLTATAHPAFAYSVAVLYDAVWLYALAQETAHRRQGSNAKLPKVIGWVFLPLTVTVLAVHGLLAGDVLAATVGALVPVLAKVCLVMAIDRDRTRISPRAQSAIDRTRAGTRDRIALSRAVATARADETKAAADILKASRQAEAEAITTTHDAYETYTEIADRHPVPDWHAGLPGLVSDAEVDALLAGGVPALPAAEPVALEPARPRPRPEVVPSGARMLPIVARPEATTERPAGDQPAHAPVVVEPSAEVVIPPVVELEWRPLVWPPAVTTGHRPQVTTAVAAETPRQVVTEVVALTPSDLRRKARALNRQLVTSTGRQVTIKALMDEYGLSRREAAELRREIVEGDRS